MTDQLETLKLKKLADLVRVEFGPPAFYHPLVADGDTPVRTGVQTPAPGYNAKMHWHPYEEILFIIESRKEAWLEGGEDDPVRLSPGDSVALPANVPHSIRIVGGQKMRLLGIHSSSDRTMNYFNRETNENGYPILYKETAAE